jgi:hypothetical protein
MAMGTFCSFSDRRCAVTTISSSFERDWAFDGSDIGAAAWAAATVKAGTLHPNRKIRLGDILGFLFVSLAVGTVAEVKTERTVRAKVANAAAAASSPGRSGRSRPAEQRNRRQSWRADRRRTSESAEVTTGPVAINRLG